MRTFDKPRLVRMNDESEGVILEWAAEYLGYPAAFDWAPAMELLAKAANRGLPIQLTPNSPNGLVRSVIWRCDLVWGLRTQWRPGEGQPMTNSGSQGPEVIFRAVYRAEHYVIWLGDKSRPEKDK